MTAQDFTERQREVIRLAARGLTHPEIGAALGITGRTARAHMTEVARRLRLSSDTTQAARKVPYAYMLATGDDPYPRPA